MKKIICLMLVVIMSMSFLTIAPLSVSAETYGNLTYCVSGGEATITGCEPTVSGSLTIPAVIDLYPVTAIGSCAFAGCSDLNYVTIPNTVVKIEYGAFAGCVALKSIEFSNSVETVGTMAFYYCSDLESALIRSSLKVIKNSAFEGCTQLRDVYYDSSQEDWSNISISYGNGCLEQATIHFDYPVNSESIIKDDNGNYKYILNGVEQTGWQEIGGYKYYFSKSTGNAFVGENKQIGSKKYSFNNYGMLMDENGEIVKVEPVKNGFITEDNKVRYYKNNEYLTGWQVIDGSKYYFAKATGNMKTGLSKIGNDYYNFSNDGKWVGYEIPHDTPTSSSIVGGKYIVYGKPFEGWKYLRGTDNTYFYKFYFSKTDGKRITGLNKQIGSSFYDFTLSGALFEAFPDKETGNAIIEIKKLAEIKNGLVKDEDGEIRYYVDGEYQTGWQTINGKRYLFLASRNYGAVTSTKNMLRSGYYCCFDENGVCWYSSKTPVDTYNVSFEADGAALQEGKTTPEDKAMLYGEKFILPENVYEKNVQGNSYIFFGWFDGISTCLPGSEYKMPARDVTFTPVFFRMASEEDLAEANFVSGAAGAAEDTNLAISAYVGEHILLPNNTYKYTGHIFNGWTDGSNVYKEGDEYTVTDDVTFTATWIEVKNKNATFTSPYAANGTIDVATGEKVTLPEAAELTPVTPAGSYTFTGWKSSEDGQIYQPGYQYTLNNDVTFTAQWTYTTGTKGDNKFVEAYAQLIDSATGNPNGTLSQITGAVNLGRNNGSVMLAKIDVRGLRNLSSMKVDFFMSKVNNGLALKAYRVSKADYDAFVAKAGTEVPKTDFPQPLATSTPISQAYSGKDSLDNYLSTSTLGTNAPFDITALAQEAQDADDDYMYVLFTTIYNNASNNGFSISSITQTNIEVVSAPGYEISYVDSDDAPIETKEYLQNATVKLLKPEKAGYIFDKWTLAGTTTTYDAEQVITITANMKLVASWFTARKITFASGNPSATGTMADVSVIDNSEYTIPKCDFVYTGKAFKHWSDGVNTYKTGDKVTITANKTLTAVWSEAYYTISFDKGTEGIGTQESVNIVSGETYTTPTATSFTSKNKVGEYALSGWTDGSNNYTLGQTITPTGSMTLKPLFEYKGGIKDQKIVIDNSVYYTVPVSTTDVKLVYNGTSFGTINTKASDFSDNGFFLGVDLGAIKDITSAKLVLPVGRSKYGSMAIYDVTAGWNGSNVMGGVTLNVGDNTSNTTSFTKPTIDATPIITSSLATITYAYEIEVDLTDYFKTLKDTSKNIMFYVTSTQGSGTDGAVGEPNNIYNRLYMPGSGMSSPAYFVIDSTYSVTTYDITYDADGATLKKDKSTPTTDAQEENAKFNLPDNVYEKNVVVGSYAFAGWSDGTNTYAAGAEYTMPAKAVTFKPVFTYTGEEKQLSTSDATYINYATYTASTSNNTTAYSTENTFVSDTSGKRICYKQDSFVYLKFDLSGLTSSDITAASLDVNYFRVLAKAGNLTVEGITETNAKASVFPATGSKSNPTTLSNVSSNALSAGSAAGTSTFDLKSYIQTRLTAGDKAIYLRLSYKGAGTAGANGVIFNNSTLKVDTRDD